ncbi:unnamed protein product [Effrenium voratum]|nr:unnamed protein product [Effrenium voratum]
MVEKQTMSGPIVITEEQESLVNRVAEVAQGMGSEIAFTVRMRGGGKRRSRGPHAQGEEGDESHEGEGGRQFSHLKPGEGGHPDFKKAVKKMQLMNTLGPQGPAFHTAMRNEKRKHAHEEGLEVVGHSDRAGLNSGSGSDQRRNRTNSISRMDSGRSGSRPGTSSSITKDQIASSLGLGSGNPVPNSPDRRPDSANSYRMAPSSTSGLSLGGLSDKEDGHGKPGQSDSQTPFGRFFSDLVDNALPGSSSLSSAMTVLKQETRWYPGRLLREATGSRPPNRFEALAVWEIDWQARGLPGEAGTSSTSARGLLLNRLIKDVDGSDEEEASRSARWG